MCFGGGSGAKAAEKEAKRARQQEERRQARVRGAVRGVNRVFDSQFTPEFFSGVKQDFMDYATPQLDDQFSDASRDLSFDLARSGLLNSSVRSDQGGRLQKLYDRNMQQITSQGLDRANQARNQVEDARGNLIMMAQATGDARGASNAAMSRASALSQPQGFSPIGQLFQDFTAGLGTQAAMERAEASSGGRFQSRYNTGLFGAPSNAVVNRR